jgi:hypothetical protein
VEYATITIFNHTTNFNEEKSMQSKLSKVNHQLEIILLRIIVVVAILLGGELSSSTAMPVNSSDASFSRPPKTKLVRYFQHRKPKLQRYFSSKHACIRHERVYPKKRIKGFNRYR